MCAVQTHYDRNPDQLSAELLEIRLNRERKSRAHAEHLLETKSRELFYLNNSLKVTAASLERQRSQLDAILNHTQAGIIFSRQNLNIRRANLAALTMYHSDESTLASLNMKNLVSESTILERLVDQSMQQGHIKQEPFETIGRSHNGEEFPIEIGVSSLDHEGSIHLVWIIRDISRRKQEEARQAALENELQRAQKLEALGTLASGVAHELNTPIQYIGDNVRFLQEAFSDIKDLIDLYKLAMEQGPDQLSQHLASINSKVEDIDLEFLLSESPQAIEQSLHGLQQAASIVKAIKNFSHPGDEILKPIDLNEAIATTLTVTRNQWKYVARVETDFDQNLPPLECRPEDINQILVNLIVNAADAFEEAGQTTHGLITIRTRLEDNRVLIEINDDGPGIPKDILSKIFDPFFTTKDVGKGSGQGLAICYSIITQKYSGNIHCDSIEGKGTSFKIILPLKKNT